MAADQPKKAPDAPEPTYTVVINNREGQDIIQLPHGAKDKHNRVMLGDLVILIPGLNLIPTRQMQIALKDSAVEAKFKTKIPRSAAPEQNPEKVGHYYLVLGPDVPVSRPLANLSVTDSIALVEEANEKQLEELLGKETREEVCRAIQERQKTLTEAEETSRPA